MLHHIQETRCDCCKCGGPLVIGRVPISYNSDLFNYDPYVPAEGWQSFLYNGNLYHLCPGHNLSVHVFIDGKEFSLG